MRRRSETIYAKSQDDFLKVISLFTQQMNEIDRQQLCKIQRKSIFTSKSDSSSESPSDESLGSHADFQISLRKLSLIEEEKEDEDSLYEFVSDLNLHLKNGKKKEFLNLLSSRVDSIKNEHNGREMPIQLLRNKILRSPRALLEGVLEDHSINTNSLKFVSENFRLYDNKLKCIVFGESGVGKSQMISYFIKVLNGERINKQKLFHYRHTESLEVHKKIVNISNRVTRLEFWDTNVSIANSSIFKSFFKIGDIFLILCRSDNETSITFMEKQLELLRTTPNLSNTYIILNHKSTRKIPGKVKNQLERIIDRFGTKCLVIDVNDEKSYTTTLYDLVYKTLQSSIKTEETFGDEAQPGLEPFVEDDNCPFN